MTSPGPGTSKLQSGLDGVSELISKLETCPTIKFGDTQRNPITELQPVKISLSQRISRRTNPFTDRSTDSIRSSYDNKLYEVTLFMSRDIDPSGR